MGAPTAATEVEHLLGALERQRATFRWKADGLDDAGHADLLREAVDGRIGEDPPGDWLPPGP